jgi:alkaline phosphatase D
VDLICLLGDTVYADGAKTLPAYRARWEENLGTAAYRARRARAPVVATWDDHDVANNWNADEVAPAQLAAARAALFEHLPIARPAEAPDRIWRRVVVAPALEVFVLDCKGELRPSRDEQVSPAQLAFLVDGLASSRARFKLVLSSVPLGDFPWPFDFVDARRWTGYPRQRTRLLRALDATSGVLVLAGDFHLGSVGRVGDGARTREVLCGPGAQRANPLWTTLGDAFEFRTGTSNVTFLRLDPTRGEVTITFVDGDGETRFERAYAL